MATPNRYGVRLPGEDQPQPTPSNVPYDPLEAARNEADPSGPLNVWINPETTNSGQVSTNDNTPNQINPYTVGTYKFSNYNDFSIEQGVVVWNAVAGNATSGIPVGMVASESDRSSFLSTQDVNGNYQPADVSRIAQDAFNKAYQDGSLESLRDTLVANNFIGGQYIDLVQDVSNPRSYEVIINALQYAASETSKVNYYQAQVGEKSFLSLNDFIKSTKLPASTSSSSGGSPTRSVRTVRQQLNVDDYQKALDDVWQAYTGSGASDKTVEKIVKDLQKKANANPEKQVTVQHGSNYTTKISGGYSADAQAYDMERAAIKAAGSGENVKATEMMDWFMKSLSSGINLGA